MKKQEKDRLRSLFQDMELSNPPKGFESRLMQQIHQAASESKTKDTLRSKIYTAIAIAGGIAAIVVLPIIAFYFMMGDTAIQIPSMQVDFSMPHFPKMDIDPLTVLLPFVVLVLLMGDTLIRKHISDKRHHNT
ncbi:hypothetical protein CLV62_101470 [Dysgonomonas alginatilytica]|uniref:Uncharacterized protein n=1 Tax=Dysgonomonas alginatilytica TaxID=1605892 RepID=A0A2V3PWH0_9BACT|nr:hypothetical protein [Dysgonomonas alginatilytica]PXV69201.1 hypothetical protein CLV62_101470 [Dysgonomonas alginatilytica]